MSHNRAMKTRTVLLILTTMALLAGCSASNRSSDSSASASSSSNVSSVSSSSVSSISSSSSAADYDTAALKQKYGDFTIEIATSGVGSYTYDESSNVYTLAVASTKAEYILQGYTEAAIVIANTSSLGSYKGVRLTLNGACIVSTGSSSAINYSLDSKNVEIKSKKGYDNKVLALGGAIAIYSGNNIEFSGKGNLELCSSSNEAHTVRASKDISIYSEPNITVTKSAHDAFHGNNLSFVNSDDSTDTFLGKLTVQNCVSQAFDFETSGGKGTITLQSGTVLVDHVDSVFKTDQNLTIASAASVTATNVATSAYEQGDNSSGLTVSILGTFTVNGQAVTA